MDDSALSASEVLAFCCTLFWTISDVFLKADLSAELGDDTSSFPMN